VSGADDRLYRRFREEVAAAGLPTGPGDDTPVTEADLSGKPEAARRYLRFMGVVGRPRDWSFRARFVGRFRLRGKGSWMPADAWQYNSGLEIGRVFCMRIRLAHLLSMAGTDSYVGARDGCWASWSAWSLSPTATARSAR
jgi:hypothetical protein